MRTHNLLLLFIFMTISACANMGDTGLGKYFSTTPKPEEKPTVQADAPLPAAGSEVFIHDTNSDLKTPVIFEQVYMAASGRYCSYYYLHSTEKHPVRYDGLACQDDGHQWRRIPMLVNAEPPTAISR